MEIDFKEDDIIINGYKDVYKVLISNNVEFICRRLSDNKTDSLTKSHFKLYYEQPKQLNNLTRDEESRI